MKRYLGAEEGVQMNGSVDDSSLGQSQPLSACRPWGEGSDQYSDDFQLLLSAVCALSNERQ